MKKTSLSLFACMALLASSCITFHGVTNNAVGTKRGVAKAAVGEWHADYSFGTAAKNAGIQKIGTWEIRYTPWAVTTTVTGE